MLPAAHVRTSRGLQARRRAEDLKAAGQLNLFAKLSTPAPRSAPAPDRTRLDPALYPFDDPIDDLWRD